MPSILFDAVIFDLDGTLVATDRFWVRAARAGAAKAFEELGIQRDLPGAAEWMSMVGLPLDEGFDQVFADLDLEQRRRVQELCVEEEHKALRSGGAALLPDAHETIDALRASGVRIGIASNCGFDYLDTMCDRLDLYSRVDAPRCLDSDGIHDKADMIEDILGRFGTRSALMVGDRVSDRDAAWSIGVPHVHLTSGFAGIDEEVHAEAVIDGLAQLVPLLEGRRDGIERILASCKGARAIGVTGSLASGKTLLARDLARMAGAEREVRVLALEDYARDFDPGESSSAETLVDAIARGFDLEGVVSELSRDTGALTILEGPYLSHPRLRSALDRLVWLAEDEDVQLRRVAGRDARREGPAPLMRARSAALPLQRRFRERFGPDGERDLVLEGLTPWRLGPLA